MTIHSPCRGVCRLDESGQYCKGCHRTLDEVANWLDFSDEQKELVWMRLLSRPLQAEEKWCSVCGNQFQCGTGGKNGGCWCQDLSEYHVIITRCQRLFMRGLPGERAKN